MASDEKETQLVRQAVKAIVAKRKVARNSPLLSFQFVISSNSMFFILSRRIDEIFSPDRSQYLKATPSAKSAHTKYKSANPRNLTCRNSTSLSGLPAPNRAHANPARPSNSVPLNNAPLSKLHLRNRASPRNWVLVNVGRALNLTGPVGASSKSASLAKEALKNDA